MTKEKKLYLALIAVFAVATVCVVVFTLNGRNARAAAAEEHRQQEAGEAKEEKKFITVEKKITAEVIEDGLRDMGTLLTEEYYFTEVTGFSSVKKLFNTIDLKFTESSYLVSYDGVITAGIDFDAIRVEKDEEAGKITIHMPPAEIQSVMIDLDSFTLYSEKAGMGNPVSVTDFNASLTELENTAKETALERGLLDRAEENAETVVRNFVGGLVDTAVYSLAFTGD